MAKQAARAPAPSYNIAPREVIAVEHPMIIMNLDRGLKTFGTNRPFRRVSSKDSLDSFCGRFLHPQFPGLVTESALELRDSLQGRSVC